jgi:hypothetical protein
MLTVHGVKCLNNDHFEDAEKALGHQVADRFTMNAFYDKGEEKVTLQCYWCNYKHEVDVGIRPLQVKKLSGEYLTLGPPIK